MDVRKHPVIRVLNAFMVCLGVVAGGLVICGLLLVFTAQLDLSDDGADEKSPSENPPESVSTGAEMGFEEATLLETYEEEVASGMATVETYLNLADLWISRGEVERAEQILRQGIEWLGGIAELEERLSQLTGQPVEEEAVLARKLRKDAYDVAGNLAWFHVYQYDDQGRMSSVTSYSTVGTQTGYVEILYDAEGREVQSYIWHEDTSGAGGTVYPVVYSYDTYGRLEREEMYYGNEVESLIYQYDQEDRVIRADTYDTNGTRLAYSLYGYDESGNLVRVDNYSWSGELESYLTWTYDAEGKRIEGIERSPDGTEFWRKTYTYDGTGNVIQEETGHSNGSQTVAYIQYEHE